MVSRNRTRPTIVTILLPRLSCLACRYEIIFQIAELGSIDLKPLKYRLEFDQL